MRQWSTRIFLMGTLYVESRCRRPLARTSYRTPERGLVSVKSKFSNNSDVRLGKIIGPGARIAELPLSPRFFLFPFFAFGGVGGVRARIKPLVPRPMA